MDSVQTALVKERGDHKITKNKLAAWEELKYEEVIAKLDKYPELEAVAKGKLDEAAIEGFVSKHINGTIKSQTVPLHAFHLTCICHTSVMHCQYRFTFRCCIIAFTGRVRCVGSSAE